MLRYYVLGSDKAEACRLAGYNPTASWSLWNKPKMRAAVAAVVDTFLHNDAAPAALRLLYRILEDDRAPAGVRVQAANSLLDRAGYGTKRALEAPGQVKDAAQMSGAELQAAIDRLQREIDGRMVDVTGDGAPVSEPMTAQELEMYE